MKRRKRFLAGVCAAVLVLSFVHIPVMSAEYDGTEGQNYSVENVSDASDIVSSGTCGTDLTWELLSDGTLKISGTGEMIALPRWYSARESIKKIIIDDDVTSIGAAAFMNCSNLSEVVIGCGVTKIESDAFYGCISLENIDIPSGVTEIASEAFFGCTNLKYVSIGSGVMTLGSQVFRDCPSLFQIEVDEKNEFFCSQDGILFSRDMTKLICYPAAKTDITYNIPKGITAISSCAFESCSNLTSVIFPETLQEIGDSSFYNCDSLSMILIPDNIMAIGSVAFSDCDNLENVVIPDSVVTIGNRAFEYCENLCTVVIGNGTTKIGYEAFAGCANLETVTIGSAIQEIGQEAFDGCDSLSDVYYMGTEAEWEKIDLEYAGLDNVTIHFCGGEMSGEMQTWIIQQINNADEGSEITVGMESVNTIPQEVLETLKGKNVNLLLEFPDGAVWSINGLNVEETVNDVDLSYTRTEKNAGLIPSDVLDAVSGECEGEQITFSQESEFGFSSSITLPVNDLLEGKKAVLLQYKNENLYLVDSDMVEESKVSFDLNGGGNYAVIYAVNGDVNGDESVNITDLMQVLQHVSGRTEMNVLQQGIADLVSDNSVNVSDLMRLLHYVSGRSAAL